MSAAPCLFEGSSGRLKLTIEGYQFPEIETDEWDSNWLIIAGEAVIDGRAWSFRDSCLTTFEVTRLAAWLDAVASCLPTHPFCGFTEPNLEFSRPDRHSIWLGFALESAPPWANHRDEWYTYGVRLPVDASLHEAAANLRCQLARFPLRGPGSEKR